MKLTFVASLLITTALQLPLLIGAQKQFTVPFECTNKTICFADLSKYTNYPQIEIDNILEISPVHRISDNDEDYLEILNHERVDEINCSTRVTLARPYSIKSVKNSWYPVVQSKFLTQKIRHVTCTDEGEQCMKGVLAQPDRFKTSCESEMGKIDLYVYDDVSKNVILMPTVVSTCCKCVIRDVTKY